MANIKILNGDGDAKYIKSSGAGSDVDPHANSVIVDSGTVTANLGATDNTVLDSIDTSTSRLLSSATRIDPGSALATTSLVAGGRYDSTQKTLTDGQEASFAMSERGAMIVTPGAESFAVNTNLGKAEDAVHSSGDVGVMALAVRKDTVGALAADGDYAPLLQNANGDIMVQARPLSAILEGGLTELVGINEQVDQNDYSGSVEVALGGTYSGEILSVGFYATEDGTGAVQDPAGILYVFDADPSISSGDTAMSAAERVTLLGKIAIAAGDWDTDANGGFAYITTQPIPFHALASLFFVWKHLDATSLNDAAGDDEQLEFNFWYRRES